LSGKELPISAGKLINGSVSYIQMRKHLLGNIDVLSYIHTTCLFSNTQTLVPCF